MKAYSEDLRRKVVEALERGLNKSQAARLFGVILSSVKRYARLAREGLPLKPGKAPGRRPKIDARGRCLLEDDLEQRPAASLYERCQLLERVIGVKVSERQSADCSSASPGAEKDPWAQVNGTSG